MANYDYLVQRRLLINEMDPATRLYKEQELLQAHFPTFRMFRSRFGDLRARGSLRTNLSNEYELRIDLPGDYPHSIPTVHPVGWDSSCPHVYASGNLCIMRPDQWRSNYSLAFAVGKTALWLNKFDVYRRRGRWPGQEQSH
jgi:hypothetical protein